MKKTLLILVVFLVSAVSFAQQRTIKVLDNETAAVTIKHSENLIHRGRLVKVGKVFKPHGIWTQHDSKNRITLTVMYLNGRKIWVERDLGATQVVINYNKHANI